jgi:hypothetical protein
MRSFFISLQCGRISFFSPTMPLQVGNRGHAASADTRDARLMHVDSLSQPFFVFFLLSGLDSDNFEIVLGRDDEEFRTAFFQIILGRLRKREEKK